MKMHICTGCGKRELRDPKKRQWCDCNPRAKFKMIIETDYKLAHKIVSAFTGKELK